MLEFATLFHRAYLHGSELACLLLKRESGICIDVPGVIPVSLMMRCLLMTGNMQLQLIYRAAFLHVIAVRDCGRSPGP